MDIWRPLENMGINLDFWKNKKIFITGHSGFKGSWLTLFLKELGCEIFGYSLEPETQPNAFEIFNLNKICKSIFDDTRNIDVLKKTINDFHPDIVIHLASKPLVRYSYQYPIETYSTNVMGLMNLLESCRNLKNKCSILNVTSDKCYFNNQTKSTFKESDSLGGNDIYSSSKACAEILSHSYQHSFFKNSPIQLYTARAGNVIGGGDWSDNRIITDIIKFLYMNKNELVIRYPNSVRPWQHVLDAIFGYLLIIQKSWEDKITPGESFNLGPMEDKEINVKELIEIYSSKIERDINYSLINSPSMHEDNKIILNSEKAVSVLQWAPKFSITNSIEQTANWYNLYYKKENIIFYSTNLIKRYIDE